MSYKVKSALYFLSFITAVTIYYNMDNDITFTTMADKGDFAKTDVNTFTADIDTPDTRK